MAFPENLQYIRTRAGMTQEQFAEQMGVSRQSVSKRESGASGIQHDHFRKKHPVIADFYSEAEKDAFHQKYIWYISGGVGAIFSA